jgi:hypothetical protein
MPSKPETLLTGRILVRLRRERPGLWVKIHGSPFQRKGLPDIIGCYRGRFVGLEVKVPGREAEVTPLQAHTLSEIRHSGGVAGVVSSPDQAIDLLDGESDREG